MADLTNGELYMLDLDLKIIITIIQGDESALDSLLNPESTTSTVDAKYDAQHSAVSANWPGINSLFEIGNSEDAKNRVMQALRTVLTPENQNKAEKILREFHRRTPLTIAVKMLGLDKSNLKRRKIINKLLAAKPAMLVPGEPIHVFQMTTMIGDAETFATLCAHFKEETAKLPLADLVSVAVFNGQPHMFDAINQLIPKDKNQLEAQRKLYNERFNDVFLTKQSAENLSTLITVFGGLVQAPVKSKPTKATKPNGYHRLNNVPLLIIALVSHATNDDGLVPMINRLVACGASFQDIDSSILICAFNYVIRVAIEDNSIALLKVLVVQGVARLLLLSDMLGCYPIHSATQMDRVNLVNALLTHFPTFQAAAKDKNHKSAIELTTNRKLQKSLQYASVFSLSADEQKVENFPGFNFLNVREEESLHSARIGFIERAFAAIMAANVTGLSIFLGPPLHATQPVYYKESAQRYRKWLKVRPELDFLLKTISLVKCYARKCFFDALWMTFEQEVTARRSELTQQFEESKTGSSEATPVAGAVELSGREQAFKTASALYDAVKLQRKAMEQCFRDEGLQAYADTLHQPGYKESWQLFDELSTIYADKFSLLSQKLGNSEKQTLKNLVRNELQKSDLEFGGLPVLPELEATSFVTQETKKVLPSTKGAAEPSFPRLARLVSTSSPIMRTVSLSDAKDSTHTTNSLTNVSQIGEAEWYERHRMMLTQQQRPKRSQLLEWLRRFYRVIDAKPNLTAILQALDDLFRPKQVECSSFEQQQHTANAAYIGKRAFLTAKFKREALKYSNEHKESDFGTDGNAVIDAILTCKIGELPLDMQCSDKGVPLLHTAMKLYKNSGFNNTMSFKVVEELMQRGATPYVMANQQTAFQYAWDQEDENGIPDWDVLSLTFKYMCTFNQLTEKICTYVANEFCPQSKKDEGGYFYDWVHDHALKTQRREELVELGFLVHETGSNFQDSVLLIWIKQKNGVVLSTQEMSQIEQMPQLAKVERAKRGGSGRSTLHKKLLQFANEALGGKLEYFQMPADVLEMLPIAAPERLSLQ